MDSAKQIKIKQWNITQENIYINIGKNKNKKGTNNKIK